MKTIISILILSLFCVVNIYGQIPVTDASAGAAITAGNALQTQNLAKNTSILTKAIATLKTLSDMKKQYDKWNENIEEVNKSIEYGKEAINIANMLGDIEDTFSKASQLINSSDLLTSSDKEKLIYVFSKLLGDCVSISSDSIDVLSSGKYKMNDAERLTLLKASESSIKEKLNLMQYMIKKIKFSNKKVKGIKYNNSILSSTNNTPLYKQ